MDALPELAEDLSSSIQLQADRLSESTLNNWDGTLTRLKEAIAAGIEASQQAKEINSQFPFREQSSPKINFEQRTI